MIRRALSTLPPKMPQQFSNNQPRGFRNHITSIAIVGAGGTIGQYITKSLLSQGKHKITAITRQDSSSALPQGLHSIKKVNYDDKSSLIEALKGQDALIITMKPMAPPDSQFKLMDAALEAGVEYIMPNEYGCDASNLSLAEETGVGAGVLKAREYVEKIGKGKMSWLGLVCGFWYEFSLAGREARYGFDFEKKALTWFDDGNTKVTMSTWEQCGRAIASLLALPKLPPSTSPSTPNLNQFANKPVYISSFNVSQREILDSVLRVTGDKESDWTFTPQSTKDRYAKAGEMIQRGEVRGHIQTLYTRVFFPGGGGDFQGKVVNGGLGLPEENLDEATMRAVRMHEEGYFEGRAA